MSSRITTDIIRYDQTDDTYSVRSHILHPQSDITIICIISAEKENVISVVEDHFLETISSTEWRPGQEDTDFSYITEKYNHFLSRLAVVDAESVSIVFAVERHGHLMVSSIGGSEVILQESGGSTSSIHEDTRGHHRFELISSGDIPVGGSVFIASRNLEGTIGDSFYSDCATIGSEAFAETTKEVLGREVGETIHLIRIQRSESYREKTPTRNSLHKEKLQDAKEKLTKTLENITESRHWISLKERGAIFFEKRQNIIAGIFFIIGIIIFLGLISYLISALFGVTGSQTKDAKNQILKARTFIESSQKLTSNPLAFDASIDQAENILRELESQQLYIKDVQDLRDKIEAMKKEIYDIQTVDLSGRKSLVPFDPAVFSPIGIYEREKKISLIGKEGAIQDYAIGDTSLRVKSYPSGEVARTYSVLDDGNFYILTDSNRILTSRKSADISYVGITGQETWENADGISNFNGNIYLWNTKEGQIYKHKPSINGFSQKNPLLSTPIEGIIDIGIDGGFYVIRNDQKITRIITSTNTQTGVTINKIPGEYTIGQNPTDTKIILQPQLNYIYILDGNRVWIFLPDSKRFQDIRSWTYIAQIELSTGEDIRSMAVARDGLLYIATDKGVYDVIFEFVDNDIILRS